MRMLHPPKMQEEKKDSQVAELVPSMQYLNKELEAAIKDGKIEEWTDYGIRG